MIFYTGVGSRAAGPVPLAQATAFAKAARNRGWVLRSGHAQGMDQAFEDGAGRDAHTYLPWKGFNRDVHVYGRSFDRPTLEAEKLAERFHPEWRLLSRAGRALHARNAHQVLGKSLWLPSQVLVCWTPNGKVVGGTATAIKIAVAWNIPVYNLARDEDVVALERLVSMKLPRAAKETLF